MITFANCTGSSLLVFPALVVNTNQRPDMLIISQTSKKIILVELTCPWEENAESAHEAKLTKYEELRCTAEENGWVTRVYAVEVRCRGSVSGTLRSCLFALGCSNTSIRSAIKECCEIAERCSTHIYLSRDKEWNPLWFDDVKRKKSPHRHSIRCFLMLCAPTTWRILSCNI